MILVGDEIYFLMDDFCIVIGCDCDPDRIGFSNNVSKDHLSWDGLKIGIPEFNFERKNAKN